MGSATSRTTPTNFFLAARIDAKTPSTGLASAPSQAQIAASMRKDMAKVIVERPRIGHSKRWVKPGRTRPLVDDEGEPLRASAREPKRAALKTKALNENLSPLRRYLESNVGRPWNKVYSDLSENLRVASAVQQHVREHVEDFVAVKTRMRSGEVFVTMRWGRDVALRESYQRLYVHPRTGILRKNEYWRSWSAKRKAEAKRRDAERAKRMRELSPTMQLHLFNNVWWEITLASVKVRQRRNAAGRMISSQQPFTDVVLRARLSALAPEELYARSGVYAVSKRQLPKAELKRLGLR